MKRFALLVILLVNIGAASAQEYNPSKVNKKAVALYTQAMERAEAGNLTNAAGLLLQSIKLDPKYLDAHLSLAGVYGQLKNYQTSVNYYEQAFRLDPGYTAEFKLPYSINLAGMGEFQRALDAINEFLEKNPPRNSTSLKAAQYRKRCFEFAVANASLLAKQAYVFAPVNAGGLVNTEESEYFPSLTIDQQELIFTRRLRGTNEDFFEASRDSNGFRKAVPVAGSVNTVQNEGAQNISQDGQMLVFTGCNRPDGLGSCDLYVSYLGPDGWSEPANLGGFVNADAWESQPCLSPDKRDLYFASSRLGGLGGIDIWVSHLGTNGKWGSPVNLGPGINTSGDEQCPFIHADNQTLYFTSNFWPGYGDDDLFISRKGPNETWAKPYNLGYPINTISREGTLFVTADGETAWYASDRSDSKGGLDLYHFPLRKDIRPLRTFWVKGKVFDQKTSKGLPSSVELYDLTGNKLVSRLQTDETGNYLMTLPVGRDYAFNVNRKGYLFYSGNFSMTRDQSDSVYRRDIPLQPIEVNASMVLNNIFFDINKFDLRPESTAELDKLVQLMQDNPAVKIEVSGHTDNEGKAADNQLLSVNRAKTVVAYLGNHRIAPARLSSKGFGASKPIALNTTADGRAQNRRTEVRITGM